MSGCRVFIGGLNPILTEMDIESSFKRFGRIRDIDLRSTYGFVEFEDPRDADDAVYEMNNQTFCGRLINVQHAKGVQRNRGGTGGRDHYGGVGGAGGRDHYGGAGGRDHYVGAGGRDHYGGAGGAGGRGHYGGAGGAGGRDHYGYGSGGFSGGREERGHGGRDRFGPTSRTNNTTDRHAPSID